jgi:DMSO reductase anchor subunit
MKFLPFWRVFCEFLRKSEVVGVSNVSGISAALGIVVVACIIAVACMHANECVPDIASISLLLAFLYFLMLLGSLLLLAYLRPSDFGFQTVIFFLLSKYRTTEYRTGKFEKISDYLIKATIYWTNGYGTRKKLSSGIYAYCQARRYMKKILTSGVVKNFLVNSCLLTGHQVHGH